MAQGYFDTSGNWVPAAPRLLSATTGVAVAVDRALEQVKAGASAFTVLGKLLQDYPALKGDRPDHLLLSLVQYLVDEALS